MTKDNRVKDAHIKIASTAINGRFSAVVRPIDLYNTAQSLLSGPVAWREFTLFQSLLDFEGTTDSTGLAILPNLPTDVTWFGVDHPHFVLPVVTNFISSNVREIHPVTPQIQLLAGTTNRMSVQLVPRGPSPFRHHRVPFTTADNCWRLPRKPPEWP